MAFANTANSNDLSIATVLGYGGSDQPALLMGWFLPTSLATSAALIGNQTAVSGSPMVRAGSADSSKVQIFNNRTTPDVLTSTSSILANNQWSFIAVLYNGETTTDTIAAALWYGIELNPPVEDTLIVTTPGVGNVSASTTNCYIASRTIASSDALIGVAGPAAVIGYGAANANHVINVNTAGAITANTKEMCFYRFVLPFWEGKLKVPHHCATLATTSTGSIAIDYYECSPGIAPQSGGGGSRRATGNTNAAPFVAVTASATSATLVRGPRAYEVNTAHSSMWKRR